MIVITFQSDSVPPSWRWWWWVPLWEHPKLVRVARQTRVSNKQQLQSGYYSARLVFLLSALPLFCSYFPETKNKNNNNNTQSIQLALLTGAGEKYDNDDQNKITGPTAVGHIRVRVCARPIVKTERLEVDGEEGGEREGQLRPNSYI